MNRLVHFEIPSTDPAKSADFYSRLFGWKMQSLDNEYFTFEMKGEAGGAIVRAEQTPTEGVVVYIAVSSIEKTLDKVEKLGGRVTMPKTAVTQNDGFWARFEDVGGCRGVGIYSAT